MRADSLMWKAQTLHCRPGPGKSERVLRVGRVHGDHCLERSKDLVMSVFYAGGSPGRLGPLAPS